LSNQQLIGVWTKDDGSDYTIEFTNNDKLIINDKTVNPPKSQTRYYSAGGGKITVKMNSNDNIPLGELPYSFPSDTKLSISGTYNNVQGTIAGTYNLVGGSTGPSTTTVETPYATPPSKDFTGSIDVTLKTDTSEATIYYTTTGADPTSSSTPYTGPITLYTTTTIKFIAIKAGLNESFIVEETYTLTGSTNPTPPAQPTANPPAGPVASGTTVTLSTTTDGATIRYTTDGNNPTATTGTEGRTVTVNAAMTIKAIAVKDGVSSDVLTASYTILPSGGLQSAITVTSSVDNNNAEETSGTLRYAIKNIANNGTITINLAAGTEIKLVKQLTINATGIKILGNGTILTPGTDYPDSNQSLILIETGKSVDISRIHFKSGKDSNNSTSNGGSAIYNKGSLLIESCIFTINTANKGGAIYSASASTATTVKGCTFYNNSARESGGAIYLSGGTLALVGNIFYMNTAPNTAVTKGPVVYKAGGTVRSDGYNIVDVAIGTGDNQSGWAKEKDTDKTLTDLGISVPINTSNLKSVATLDNFISSVPSQFPATYFDGTSRGSPCAPGAQK